MQMLKGKGQISGKTKLLIKETAKGHWARTGNERNIYRQKVYSSFVSVPDPHEVIGIFCSPIVWLVLETASPVMPQEKGWFCVESDAMVFRRLE